MTAALPMGAQKITGMAEPTVSTDAATKNYVDTITAAFFSTGDVKLTFKTVVDAGWLFFDDGTFGNAGSGSSNSNNVANLALFTLFFNNITDANAPILTSGGGATTRAAQTNAATAWAALCRMSLPKTLGRALAISGAGSGLTARTLGQSVGLETYTLLTTNLPAYTPSGTVISTVSGGTIAGTGAITNYQVGGATTAPIGQAAIGVASAFTGVAQGGASTAFSIMQPTTFLNCMVKI